MLFHNDYCLFTANNIPNPIPSFFIFYIYNSNRSYLVTDLVDMKHKSKTGSPGGVRSLCLLVFVLSSPVVCCVSSPSVMMMIPALLKTMDKASFDASKASFEFMMLRTLNC